MMKLFKPGGAISVFLVIILVPCLVVSFLFVDLSRIELSKAVVASSADMALNSLMSHYDIDLNEYYGLVASCQNIDEFYEETEKYFQDSLSAAGLGEDSINDVLTMLESSGAGAADLLQVASVDETLGVHPIDNSGLGESPVLIKEGVVEFMKYRAPFELAQSFLATLMDEGAENIKEQMADSEEISDLSDARNEFAETESELNKAEFYTFYYYNKYLDYTYHDPSGSELSAKPSTERLEDIKGRANTFRDNYKNITKRATESLWMTWPSAINSISIGFNSYENQETHFMEYKRNTGEKTFTKEDVAEEIDDSNEENLIYYLAIETLKEQKTTVDNKITELEGLLDDETLKLYADMDYGTEDDQYNELQWYYFANKAYSAKVGNITTKAWELVDATNKLSAMTHCSMRHRNGAYLPNEEVNGTISTVNETITKAKKLINGNFYTSNSDTAFRKLYHALRGSIKDKGYYCTASSAPFDDSGANVESSLSGMAAQLTLDAGIVQGYVDLLTSIVDGNSMLNLEGVEGIKNLISTYGEDYQVWYDASYINGDKINDVDVTAENYNPDNIYEANQAEIATDYKEEKLADPLWVEEFGNKLRAVISVYNDVVTGITGMKYGSKCVKDIPNYTTFEKQFDDEFTEPESPMKNSAIDAEADRIFNALYVPLTGDIFTIPDDFNPTLSRGEDKYYDFLLDKGYDISSLDSINDAVTSAEGDMADWEEQGGNTENPEENAPEPDIKGVDINTGDPDGDPFGLTDVVSALASIITELVNMNGDGIRDAVYVTVYARNMFTFRTYDNEGLYELATAAGEDVDYLTCDKDGGVYSKYNVEGKGKWKDDSLDFSNNKSLTNKMFAPEYNAAYGAELEYILYGSTNKQNCNSAYRDIYIIRLAMNTASGFVNFYKNSDSSTATAINGIAVAVNGATQGIIPVAFVKCVLILLLAALESIADMDRLLAGIPVELYKSNEEQWVYSLDRIEAGASSTGRDAPSTEGDTSLMPDQNELCLRYSDYLFIFLYSGFQDNNSSFYTRLGNVIQANMKLVTKNTEYDLVKAKTMFAISGTMEVTPLMMDLPLSSDYEDGLLESLNWKRFGVEIIRGY